MALSEQRNQDSYFHDNKQEQEDERLLNQSNGYHSHVVLQGQVRPQTEFNNINPHVVDPTGYTTMASNGSIYQEHYVNHNLQKQDQDKNQDRLNNAGGIEIDESSGIVYFHRHEGTPMGLNLRMSISLVNQIRVPWSQPNHKLKVSNIPADSLKIGLTEWVSRRPQDLTVKFYYRSKKLVWEFLCGALKKKISIRWSQISAINKFMNENKTSRLEIELKEQPELFEEVNYEAKKHTVWAPTKLDFTKGEAATTWRRHTLVFLPGVLDDPFKNLMQCDNRLSMLSRQPFPYHNSPIFQDQILDVSYNRSINGGPSIVPNYDRGIYAPYPATLAQPIHSLVGHSSSSIPTPDCNPNGERDDIPDEQQILQKPDIMNVSEFDIQETNTSADLTCEPLKSSDEMKSNDDGNNGIVSKEPNSCLPVDATMGIDDWDFCQFDNGVNGVDQLGLADVGELDAFPNYLISNLSWE